MESIYLIGFMGAGKTTVGKALADCLAIPVFDIDEEIEKKENRSISEIFEHQNEAYFRTLETKTLQELPRENAIITTGGGVVTRIENREAIKKQGKAIFLFATAEEIMKRLEEDDSRPLLRGDKKRNISELYEARMSFYKEIADFIIDTTDKKTSEIVKEIVDCLKQSC